MLASVASIEDGEFRTQILSDELKGLADEVCVLLVQTMAKEHL